ncbi:MAG: lysostaphin resistance A-like protein [Candidatus Acidiferrales bacterium]
MISDDQNQLPPEESLAPAAEPPPASQVAPDFEAAPLQPAFAESEDPTRGLTQFPEDLRAPWGWVDLAFFAIIAFLGTFVVSLILVFGFALVHPQSAANPPSLSEKSVLVILSQTVLLLALLGYLFVQMRVRFEMPFWRTIGWRPLETGQIPRRAVYLSLVLGGFVLSLLIQVASSAFQNKTKVPIESFFQDRRSAFLLMLMGVLVAPLVEETIFRGYLYPVLARSFGIRSGVVVTGTLFGLLHAPQLWGAWGQIALLVVVGIIFTAARALMRTVVASYLLHVSYNSFLFIAFLVASHGLRQLPVGP